MTWTGALCAARSLRARRYRRISPWPSGQRFQRTVHRALIALGAVLLAVAAVVCAAFGIPGLLIALLVGAALFTLAKLLLTQGPLGTKLAKFFSLG